MTQFNSTVRSYDAAREYLGDKQDRSIGHNTRLVRRDDGAICVKYHGSPVVTYMPTEMVTGGPVTILNSCGWLTMTTKERINAFCPDNFRVWSDRGTWRLYRLPITRDPENESWTFADGITIDSYSRVFNAGPVNQDKMNRKLTATIRAYAKKYAAELVAGNIPEPGAGDCFYCAMVAEDGTQVGGNDHLKSHLEESYLVPSLLMQAIKSKPMCQFSMGALGCLWNKFPDRRASDIHDFEKGILTRDVTATLTHYLKHNLGLAS